MTVCELISLLKEKPEDAEVLVYSNRANWSAVIDDSEPLSEVEHAQDGTPIIWIYTEV